MAHDLIIGGSGMLAGLVKALANEGRTVSVLARNNRRLEQLAALAPGIQPLPCDYHNSAALHQAISEATTTHGPIERTICWIHDSAPEALGIVAPFTTGAFLHVFGSAAADPANPEMLDGWRARFDGMPLVYKQVILGFVKSGGASRWLDHDEISGGVLNALNGKDLRTTVGVTAPWSDRP